MSTLGLANVINVSLLSNPSRATENNVNTLALFTTEASNFVEPYTIYTNTRSAAADFGSDSRTKALVDIIFGQNPNILSGDGYLTVIPLINSASATFGKFVTADLTANIANIIVVSDGEFTISLNGSDIDVTGLDFTSASDCDDIIAVIKKALLNVFIEQAGDVITFTSKIPGASSSITFSAVAGGTGTDLTGASYLNITGGASTNGADATGETIAEAIARTQSKVHFTGVVTDLVMESDVVESLAIAVQALEKIFFTPILSTEDIGGLATTIKASSNTKTRVLLHTDGLVLSQNMAAAYASKALSTNFNGSRSTRTMNLKTLEGITPDTGVNDTVYQTLDSAGVDAYISYEGIAAIYSSGGNNYFDNIFNDMWFKAALQIAGFNYLRATSTKIYQTENGMDGLKGAYEKIVEQGIKNGSFAVGLEWESSDTFGNPDDLRRNIRDKGFYIYSTPIAQQSQSDRSARKAPLIQIAAKRAGAIHSSDLIALVQD